MNPVFLIIRNDEEYLGKYLAEFRKVGVCGLDRDGIELFKRFGKKGGDVVRENCTHREVAIVGCC